MLQSWKFSPSSEHSNVTASVVEKVNVALRLSVTTSGVWPSVTGGGTSPISQLHSAGVSSTSPPAVRARTSNSCSSLIRPVYVVWASHGDQSAASSSMHSNVTPGKSEENSNSAVVLSVASGGATSMKVSSECCVQVQRAGVASNMPNSFTARTRSSCSPGSRPSKSWSASHELHSGTGASSEHSNVGASSVFD